MKKLIILQQDFMVNFISELIDLEEKLKNNIFNKDIGFMTATKREGQWLNSVEAPYTKQYYKIQPKLSELFKEKQKRIDKIRSKNIKKSRNQKIKSPPFNTQANRSFEKSHKRLGPGPGSYIDINDPKHSSVLHSHTIYGNPQIESMKRINIP